MNKTLLLASILLFPFAQNKGQSICDDYKIVSIFDIPPSPQSPGGNYFLLLLTLKVDHPNNFDNYANLFFKDEFGDTISIPTGSNSTLPKYASDTIPYILKLNSTSSNQDFTANFKGKLIIEHITQLVCGLDYSNEHLSTKAALVEPEIDIYPNPFVEFINIDSNKSIESVKVMGYDGNVLEKFHPKSNSHQLNLENLSGGDYLLLVQFEDGESLVYKICKV